MIGSKSIGSVSVRPPEPCMCLVLERGHEPAHEFIADFPELEQLVSLRFTGCEVVIVIRSPDGVLNSVGCDRTDVIGAILHAIDVFGITHSRWGVLCSPAISLPAMALFNGTYDFLLEEVA